MSDLRGETTSSVELAALVIADWHDRGYTVGRRDERAAIVAILEAALDAAGRNLADEKSGPQPVGPREEVARVRRLAWAFGAFAGLRDVLTAVREREGVFSETAQQQPGRNLADEKSGPQPVGPSETGTETLG